MRTVALGAFPRQDGRMLTRFILYLFTQVRMTGETKHVLFVDEHPRNIAAMGRMASKTHPFGKGHMIKRASTLLFHYVFVANCA